MLMALRLKYLCMQVRALRKRRRAGGWYKGSALWGKQSVEAGREYRLRMAVVRAAKGVMAYEAVCWEGDK